MATLQENIMAALEDQREEDEGQYSGFILLAFTEKGRMQLLHDVNPLEALGAVSALQHKLVERINDQYVVPLEITGG